MDHPDVLEFIAQNPKASDECVRQRVGEFIRLTSGSVHMVDSIPPNIAKHLSEWPEYIKGISVGVYNSLPISSDAS